MRNIGKGLIILLIVEVLLCSGCGMKKDEKNESSASQSNPPESSSFDDGIEFYEEGMTGTFDFGSKIPYMTGQNNLYETYFSLYDLIPVRDMELVDGDTEYTMFIVYTDYSKLSDSQWEKLEASLESEDTNSIVMPWVRAGGADGTVDTVSYHERIDRKERMVAYEFCFRNLPENPEDIKFSLIYTIHRPDTYISKDENGNEEVLNKEDVFYADYTIGSFSDLSELDESIASDCRYEFELATQQN